jgi:hypothetical protein
MLATRAPQVLTEKYALILYVPTCNDVTPFFNGYPKRGAVTRLRREKTVIEPHVKEVYVSNFSLSVVLSRDQ